MAAVSAVSSRLRRLRSELDEVGEQLERLAAATEPVANDSLVGSHEVEEMAGVPRSTLRNWRRSGKLPTPVAELRCGSIWLRADIEEWLQSL